MEIKPRPVGVLTGSASAASSSSNLALTGKASGFSNLTAGYMYYTNTKGELVTDGKYYGRSPGTSSISADEYDYVSTTTGSSMVTLDSQVGLAISSDTVLLRWYN
jgi:hypothetical protein